MKEAYVNYETANLLKEKGFDWDCDNYYDQSSDEPQQFTLDEMYYSYDEFVKAPTHQMACAWLRGKGIFFCVHPDYPISKKYIVEFYDNGVPSGVFGNYEKYEDATEAAIKYALENLI